MCRAARVIIVPAISCHASSVTYKFTNCIGSLWVIYNEIDPPPES